MGSDSHQKLLDSCENNQI